MKAIGGIMVAIGLLMVMGATGSADANLIGMGQAVAQFGIGGALMMIGGRLYA